MPARLAFLWAAALIAGVAVGAASLIAITGYAFPERRLALVPKSPEADAAHAVMMLERAGTEAEVRGAQHLAQQALRGAPTSVVALRTIGLAEARLRPDEDHAGLFDAAYAISRRDTPVNFEILRRRASAGDDPGAIATVDLILRTDRAQRPSLYDALLTDLDRPGVREALAAKLAERPVWRRQFLASARARPDRAEPMFLLLDALRRKPGGLEPGETAGFLEAAQKSIPPLRLRRLWGVLHGVEARAGEYVFNGRFEVDGPPPPFNWSYSTSPGAWASHAPRGSSHRGLLVEYHSSTPELLAKQTLTLSPGSYRLSLAAFSEEAVPAGRFRWTIGCASARNSLLRLDLPSGTGRRRLEGRFRVPAGCTAQRLELFGIPRIASRAGAISFDSVGVRRVS